MKLTVKNPCQVDWNGMTGCEKRRFCDHCEKHVHDLSALTEEEGRALLATPGVCARFKTDAVGNVRFRDSMPTAAAMVLAAVFAATPAHAGGKAATEPADGGWVDWVVDLVAGVALQGEPMPIEPAPELPYTGPDEVLMGDVAMIVEPAETFTNDTRTTKTLVCTDAPDREVAPGESLTVTLEPGQSCALKR
ncbi:MAG: hypothetical protein H6737_31765 [Alphaproteobacteria bacterium]|nr:hypothetical protein [Alphaproteobacteria bacterium]